MFHAGQRGRTIAGEFFGDREARRGFGSSFGNILKFAFELKNMCAIFFGRKRSEAKRPTERGRRSKSAERGRGFKWRAPTRSVGRRPFKPQTVLLHRRTPVGSEWIWRSQTRYRSDFKRTWVRLGERGRRDRLGARRGESLFSLIWIEISHKRFWELSVVNFITDPKMNSVSGRRVY